MFNQNRYTSITIPTKSVTGALVLTFLFGPLGMFYVTVTGAIIMLIASIVVFISTLGFGLIFIWPIQLIWTAIAVHLHNKKVMAKIIYYNRTSLKRRAFSL